MKFIISFIFIFQAFSSLNGPQDLEPYPEYSLPHQVNFQEYVAMDEFESKLSEHEKELRNTWTPQNLNHQGLTLVTGRRLLDFDKKNFLRIYEDFLTQDAQEVLEKYPSSHQGYCMGGFWLDPYMSASLIGGEEKSDPLGTYGLILKPDPHLMLCTSNHDITTMRWEDIRAQEGGYITYFQDLKHTCTYQGMNGEPLFSSSDFMGPKTLMEHTGKGVFEHNEIVMATKDEHHHYLSVAGFWYADTPRYPEDHMCHKPKLEEQKLNALNSMGSNLKLPVVPLSTLAKEGFHYS